MLTFRFSVIHRLPSNICLDERSAPGARWPFNAGCFKQEAPTNKNAILSAFVTIRSRTAVTMSSRDSCRGQTVNERFDHLRLTAVAFSCGAYQRLAAVAQPAAADHKSVRRLLQRLVRRHP